MATQRVSPALAMSIPPLVTAAVFRFLHGLKTAAEEAGKRAAFAARTQLPVWAPNGPGRWSAGALKLPKVPLQLFAQFLSTYLARAAVSVSETARQLATEAAHLLGRDVRCAGESQPAFTLEKAAVLIPLLSERNAKELAGFSCQPICCFSKYAERDRIPCQVT